MKTRCLSVLISLLFAVCFPPSNRRRRYGPVPTARQLAWHQLERYAFIHFTVNTFTDREWGNGENRKRSSIPPISTPIRSSARSRRPGCGASCSPASTTTVLPLAQQVYRALGQEQPLEERPGRRRQGDLRACRRQGLKFGVYSRPGTAITRTTPGRNTSPITATNSANCSTNYGPIFEFWFDGANGGDGYYGGARERRNIDNREYYDWENTWKIVRKVQPQACMFSDGGPDVRWIGNESGFAGETCWATVNRAGTFPGNADSRTWIKGCARRTTGCRARSTSRFVRAGSITPARTSTPLARQSAEDLLRVGGPRANLILNIPPDRRGRIHKNNVKSLREWRRLLDATFAHDLAQAQRHRLEHPRQRQKVRRRECDRRQGRHLLGNRRWRDYARVGAGPGQAGGVGRAASASICRWVSGSTRLPSTRGTATNGSRSAPPPAWATSVCCGARRSAPARSACG